MSAEAITTPLQAQTRQQQDYPQGGLRFDWIFAGLGALLIAGLWVDGWAHFHGLVDDSFFTPWHFLFYSAFGIVALFVAANHWRNVAKGYHFQRALPQGYWLSLLGVVLFAAGGVGDMIWHTLFGIEDGSEALTSPTHIMLAIGMALIITGPVRAAWLRYQQGEARNWLEVGPALIGMTLLLALLAFFTSYAHPLINLNAADFGGDAPEIVQNSQLYIMNADGTQQTRLSIMPDVSLYSARWSPDGSRIVYAQGAPDNEEVDLYVMNADGTGITQLTRSPGSETSPAWSPDGTQIVFVGTQDDSTDLFVMPADGGEATRLTQTDVEEWSPAWSPDGSQIAYVARNGNGGNIHVMSADGTNDTTLTSDNGSWLPSWSPDGSQILFSQRREGGFEVALMNADGSNITQLTDSSSFDGFASFSPDGTQVLFVSWRSGSREVYTMPVTGEVNSDVEPMNITQNPALLVNDASFAPDGSKIIFTAQGQQAQDDGGFELQDFGMASVLLQAALLATIVALMIWRWRLPFGALTLLLAGSTAMLTILTDMFLLIPAALLSGLIADVLLRLMQPSAEHPNRFYGFAFLVPLLFFALYFLTIQLTFGIGWSVHVWTGAIFLSGMIGLLVAYFATATQHPVNEMRLPR